MSSVISRDSRLCVEYWVVIIGRMSQSIPRKTFWKEGRLTCPPDNRSNNYPLRNLKSLILNHKKLQLVLCDVHCFFSLQRTMKFKCRLKGTIIRYTDICSSYFGTNFLIILVFEPQFKYNRMYCYSLRKRIFQKIHFPHTFQINPKINFNWGL